MPRPVTALVAVVLAAVALLAVGGALSGPVRWTPDGLFYQARAYELSGATAGDALERAFEGPMGAELRRIDPERSGDPAWVSYSARFYERRVTLPLAATALEPAVGDRAILDLSLLGYLVAILAIFALLLLRFRLPIAAAVTLVTIFLPALTHHSSFPLTDSWGLALETAAVASAILVLERGRRWLLAWFAAILILSFTRDSTWILIAAAGWLTLSHRSRVSVSLLVTGLAASIPVLLAFPMPMRELLATMLNQAQPAPDASWAFIADRYPGALVDLLQADGGFVRDGAWYSAAYVGGGLVLLFLLARGARATPGTALLKAAAVASVAYVLAVPIFSAFRLELACVPMAAFGIALAAEWLTERAILPAWSRAPVLSAERSGP